MKRVHFFIIIILIQYYPLHSQSVMLRSQKVVFYASFQSTVDKDKNPQRIQFGGDNALFNSYFSQVISGLKFALPENVNGTSEIIFRVNSAGDVDSLIVEKPSGVFTVDEILRKLILSTSGKWKPAEVDGQHIAEWNHIWIHVYSGDYIKKTLEEYITASEKFLEQGKGKKALQSIDKALYYNPIYTKSILIKADILDSMNNHNEACALLEGFLKYNSREVERKFESICH